MNKPHSRVAAAALSPTTESESEREVIHGVDMLKIIAN
jgi:hypothetical protein